MQLILIFLTVIMLLVSVKSEKSITDLSDRCSSGENIVLPLTTGIGVSDTSVAMVAIDGIYDCTIKFSVKSQNHVMVVVEFPDWRPNERACNDNNNSVLMVSGNSTEENVCKKFNVKAGLIYRKSEPEALSVRINSMTGLRTIKLTATALRDPKSFRCNNTNEVECLYDSSIYCMNEITKCDGHNNCGVLKAYDESDKFCLEHSLTIRVALITTITVIILLVLFIAMIVQCTPSKRKTFIYTIHESTSLFDTDEDIMNIDINIYAVFPSQLDESPNKPDTSVEQSSSKKGK